jgi:antitoxin YefM
MTNSARTPPNTWTKRAAIALYIKRDAGSVVMVSEDEFEGLVETAHLLGSRANASRLLASIKAAEAGELHERGLIEE